MSFSLNRAELIGRLGRAPEMRYTAEGQAVTKFSLATDRPAKAGTKAETDWHQITCWGKLAEFANAYLTKGRLVFVAGRIAYRTWEGRDGVKRHGNGDHRLRAHPPRPQARSAETPVEDESETTCPSSPSTPPRCLPVLLT